MLLLSPFKSSQNKKVSCTNSHILVIIIVFDITTIIITKNNIILSINIHLIQPRKFHQLFYIFKHASLQQRVRTQRECRKGSQPRQLPTTKHFENPSIIFSLLTKSQTTRRYRFLSVLAPKSVKRVFESWRSTTATTTTTITTAGQRSKNLLVVSREGPDSKEGPRIQNHFT